MTIITKKKKKKYGNIRLERLIHSKKISMGVIGLSIISYLINNETDCAIEIDGNLH